ncbi:MAG TPA: prolipoprotein diacylglyceryl transferase [Stellaceae bacterium]|nr:prolipoprotein diacylglyceryl transferase [Stellaceae bacterium]
MLAIPFPNFDPIAVSFGPFAIRWYALAYIVGLLLGWRYCLWVAKRPPAVASPQAIDDFLVWATLGVVLGGRAGYVLFYKPDFYFANPSEIVKLWHGGMSFHGGALGVLVALWLFCRQRGIALLAFADIVTPAVPIGIFFGRVANFINGELWGRPTTVPWGVIYPDAGVIPRHPSELYEASLEGLVLFLIMFFLVRHTSIRERPGLTSGVFLIGYACARIFCEFFREPDAFLGFLWFGATMGQLLSIPVLLLGLWLAWRAKPESK